MIADEKPQTVTINVDGKDYDVPAGMNCIDALETIGIEVPHYCYHPKLSVAGNCRMCLVEMGMPMSDRATKEPILDEATGKQKIGWMPKPAIACNSKVSPNLHLKTQSKLVQDCQEGVMEFLLVNHPLDCPICDQAGECRLQEFATDYGRGYSRFVEQKNVKPKRTRLGPRVTLDDERCILCSRCVRFCNEIIEDPILGFIERGSYSTLTCHPGRELDSNYSLNTVDICPVGALTSTDFRFKMRVWFLKAAKGICTESSVGANTEVWSREGKIYRITPRRNDAVNDTWMSDSGRMLYKQVEAEDRLSAFKADGRKSDAEEALARAVELLSVPGVAYVANGRMSVEEQYQLRRVIEVEPGGVHLVSHTAEGDGLLISADRTPNVRGALVTGLVRELPVAELTTLRDQAEAGEVQTVVVINEDLTEAGFPKDKLKKLNIIYIGTHANATSEAARVVLPSLTVFEKRGSFVNQQFRLQRFEQAVPGPAGLVADGVLLDRLAALLRKDAPKPPVSVAQFWREMAQNVEALQGIAYKDIGEAGLLLDPAPWKDLPFCEGPSLHFAPESEAAAEPAPVSV
ncbi:MAG: 2Fe-2S iron-sulfur cluster-binding protein [Opitutales bacterium]